jgi:phosphoribosylformimino-5-aminoimidazole carboxamide ribotide isomerase
MLIIPAVDIKAGKCVRLIQGERDRETIYSDDPCLMAQKWVDMGAELLHLVDLDGAFEGKPVNFDIIKQIVSSIKIPVQLGGGIRTLKSIEEYFSVGVNRVILGTAALEDHGMVKEACRISPDRIILGLDAKDGYVAVKGWTQVVRKRARDLVKEFEGLGLRAIIYTDIKRDGMMTGPNIQGVKELAPSIKIPLIVSGGISSLKDIEDISNLKEGNIEGMIIGKALYEKSIDFKEALRLVKRKSNINAC